MSPVPPDRLRLAVFASGGGSNFSAIAEAIEAGALEAELRLCVSNRRDAGVIERAHGKGISTVVMKREDYETDPEYAAKVLSILENYDVNFIALAGYLKKIPSEVVQRFRHRMVNIHPALLPAFGGKGMYGRHVHSAVLTHGVRWTGATVHLVDQEYDTGPIVLQEPVPVYPDDTVETLAARVLQVEHRLYPEALQLFATGRVQIEGRVVTIATAPAASREVLQQHHSGSPHDRG